MIITAGKTNVTVDVYFVDDDGGTAPGEPTTGLLFSDIETGGSASYHRQGAARVDLTLVTQTVAGAHADGGFIEIDATNMPGLYRLDLPDAAFTTGIDYVMVQCVAAAANNSIMRPLMIDVTDVDLRDSVRGGMTALPNAAANAAGGLTVSIAGALDLDAMNTNINDIETDTTDIQSRIPAALVGGAMDSDVSVIQANAISAASIAAAAMNGKGDWNIGKTGYSLTQSFPTNFADMAIAVTTGEVDANVTELAGVAQSLTDLKDFADAGYDPATNKVQGVVLVDTTTTNTDMVAAAPSAATNAAAVWDEDATGRQTTGTFGAAIGDPGASVETIYDAVITDATGTNVATDVVAVKAETALIVADTNELQADWVDTGRLDTILDGRMAETSINTTGGAVDTVTTLTGHTGQTGDNYARLGAPTGASVSADIVAVQADTDDIQTRIPAALVGGAMDSDVSGWLGTAVGADTAGVPNINVSAISNNGESAISLSRWLLAGATSTADSGSTTTVVDTARTEADDVWNGATIIFYNGALIGQARLITDFDAATDTITFAPPVTTGVTTEGYVILPTAGADVQSWLGTASALAPPNALVAGAVDADVSAIQAAAVDTIWDEAMTETTGAPAITGTFRDAIKWLFALSRNKITQTSTTTTLRNDADAADLSTSTVSDDATTYTRGEWST